jgi:hypothetical protein
LIWIPREGAIAFLLSSFSRRRSGSLRLPAKAIIKAAPPVLMVNLKTGKNAALK